MSCLAMAPVPRCTTRCMISMMRRSHTASPCSPRSPRKSCPREQRIDTGRRSRRRYQSLPSWAVACRSGAHTGQRKRRFGNGRLPTRSGPALGAELSRLCEKLRTVTATSNVRIRGKPARNLFAASAIKFRVACRPTPYEFSGSARKMQHEKFKVSGTRMNNDLRSRQIDLENYAADDVDASSRRLWPRR
jgi:hypothetical protein